MNAAEEIKNALAELSRASDLDAAEMLASSIMRNSSRLATGAGTVKTVRLLSADLVELVHSERQFGKKGKNTTRLSESFFRSFEILRDQMLKVLAEAR